MHNTLLVLKNEIQTTIGRRSFWVMTFLFPLLIIGLTLVPQLLAGDDLADDPQDALAEIMSAPSGFVDRSGLIQETPPGVPPEQFSRFDDETAAQAALAEGQIERYYLIPDDFLETGQVTAVSRQFNILGGLTGGQLVSYVASYNLSGDASLARLLLDPTAGAQQLALAPDQPAAEDGPMSFFVPFAAMFILFFIITMSAGFMLQSVAKEKENRTAEVLLLSLNPRQLMWGKMLGLSLVALLQMVIWLGGSLFLLQRGSSMLAAAGELNLSPGVLVAVLVYFLCGFLLYASLLGALGALAPTMREGAQFTFIIILPLLVPIWLNSVFTADPDAGLALFFSLFPLTAPTAMVARLTITQVPAWQLALSLVGLLATTYAFILLAARFFRADTLLSDASLSLRTLLQQARRGLG